MKAGFSSQQIFTVACVLLTFLFFSNTEAKEPRRYNDKFPVIHVDNEGRMRRADTGGEVRYYGTNYTLPFAHAYRAIDRLGISHKEAIDRDVYHMARLGLNAFRVHLWDVEISDSIGNLLDNRHLDLLDYLISKLEQRGISVILTAQTNFGNGYPERDIDTGAYTYDYAKCDIHANPDAIKAQQRYARQLAAHMNPYTGLTYADNNAIIAIEINNEPCHQSSPRQVTDYIITMVKAFRKGGWKKPLLYNVSHNMEMVAGYYAADIQGTTYQWYPVGLVSGHERRGNFLPYVDNYAIPFNGTKGFGNKAKVVYEFDPADMLESYIFPAVARTFAREGFQWATQFAYDPIDMARFNTEYQTHYLNLAYTPQKALGMKIAAHVMRHTPNGADVGKYPADTVFSDVTVSYRRNLALLNTPREYVHTNNVDVPPVNPDSLRQIAGYGTSPVVKYQGRGAYFLDKLADGLWRLEVMPDVLFSTDPFEKPSLTREVAHILPSSHPMTINLPDLGQRFSFRAIAGKDSRSGTAEGSTLLVHPGVYLLGNSSAKIAELQADSRHDAFRLNEYAMPPVTSTPLHVNHIPAPTANADKPLVIRAEAFGSAMPDSLVIYPAEASFWRKDNRLYTMHPVAPYIFEAVIPAEDIAGKTSFTYRIAAIAPGESRTFPDAINGLPLDWDAPESGSFSTTLLHPGDPVILLNPSDGLQGTETSTIPDEWGRSRVEISRHSPMSQDAIKVSVDKGEKPVNTILTLYTGGRMKALNGNIAPGRLVVKTGAVENLNEITVSLVNRDGITYSKTVHLSPDSEISIGIGEMAISPTLLCPAPFPTFLSHEFIPEGYGRPLDIADVEKLQLVFPGHASTQPASAEIIGAWLTNE